MCNLSPKIGIGLTVGVVVVSLALTAAAGPQKKGHKPRKSHALSAQEARAASAKKYAIRQNLRRLQGKMHDVRARIHVAVVKEHRITDTIETVNARIARTQGRIARVREKLDRLAADHDTIVKRLDQTQERLRKRKKLLARRLQDNYTRGETTYMLVLLQSDSLHDMLSRNYYVRHIVKSDMELIEGVKADVRQVAADKKALEDKQKEQQSLAEEYESEKQQYLQDRATQKTLLSQVQETRQEAEDELDDLEAESETMTSRIRALSEMLRQRQEAERHARAEARRRQKELERRQKQAQGKPAPPDEPDKEEESPVWRGGFIHPVSARVTSGFGYRYHPILHRRKLHTGVDFGARYGTPIHAAAGGTVILAGHSGGYGNCVIIDHGGGTTTLYGHCSSLSVSEGREVRQGEIIGHVGSTGMSTGPHLHFEVRRNGVPVRPF